MSQVKSSMSATSEEQIILDILTKETRLSSIELFTRYQHQSSSPITFRSFKKHLISLCSKHLVQYQGEKRWRTYTLVPNRIDKIDDVDEYLPKWTKALRLAYVEFKTKNHK
jgi:hypothetical protein